MAGSYPFAGVFIFLALVLPEAVVVCEFPATLTLERAFPANQRVQLSQLRARDRLRHGRILQSLGHVAEMTLQGTYSPFLVGLYYSRVRLGSPPKEFYVQIDTGSDALWVNCNACNNCPTSSGLRIPINFFNPSSSSTASLISCSDKRCSLGSHSSDARCSNLNDRCSYSFQYGDGSGTIGYYVSDKIHFNTVRGNSSAKNASAPIVFGCSTSRTGDLIKSDRAIDGIFGFGQRGISAISQLYSLGVTPYVFSHCLKGDNVGGGTLVFGEIVDPNIVYSPLVPSQGKSGNIYIDAGRTSVELSIGVNGKILPVNPAAFATSDTRGTIIDSGTTLVYLVDEAYDPLLNTITGIVSQLVRPFVVRGTQCYKTSSNISEIFPTVSLNFAGGASMSLKPQDYLIQHNSYGTSQVWCFGVQKSQGQGLTILGDLVLKDKIIVYDLARQRIGWANYNCSSPVNVSTSVTAGVLTEVIASQKGGSSSSRSALYMLITTIIMPFLLHSSVFGSSSFL